MHASQSLLYYLISLIKSLINEDESKSTYCLYHVDISKVCFPKHDDSISHSQKAWNSNT